MVEGSAVMASETPLGLSKGGDDIWKKRRFGGISQDDEIGGDR